MEYMLWHMSSHPFLRLAICLFKKRILQHLFARKDLCGALAATHRADSTLTQDIIIELASYEERRDQKK